MQRFYRRVYGKQANRIFSKVQNVQLLATTAIDACGATLKTRAWAMTTTLRHSRTANASGGQRVYYASSCIFSLNSSKKTCSQPCVCQHPGYHDDRRIRLPGVQHLSYGWLERLGHSSFPKAHAAVDHVHQSREWTHLVWHVAAARGFRNRSLEVGRPPLAPYYQSGRT